VLASPLRLERTEKDRIVALAGNPNVGKSTVFNGLTGLNQHTGNWPGKTVTHAQGKAVHQDKSFILVDLPGTYSLMANSVEEEIARDFICFGQPHVTVVVADATCLERNLNLVLQTLEITHRVVVCVNLLDEAQKKKIKINLKELSRLLGVPVIGASARSGKGLDALMDAVHAISEGKTETKVQSITYDTVIENALDRIEPTLQTVPAGLSRRWVALRLLDGDKSLLKAFNECFQKDLLENVPLVAALQEAREELSQAGIDSNLLRDKIVSRLVLRAEEICRKAVCYENKLYNLRDRKVDKILTSRTWGIPSMLLLLAVIFWLTITGANYPSSLLATGLFWVEEQLAHFMESIAAPAWVSGLFVEGMWRTLAWVVSVMLPPMAIFFPLFTLLEDLGYLPRIAFNLDNFFKKACTHGKQALTMCMGFGCNAAGVIGCRIIDSPRERLIATLTNNFVPCNGRFPTLIALIAMFFAGIGAGPFSSVTSALILLGVIVLGVMMTLWISKLLSKTLLKGLPSSFTLELPPYRRPQIGRVIIRSVFDRTLFVLGRAVAVAAPAGLVIWVLANVTLGDRTLLAHFSGFLDPLGRLMGMDGIILMAFILGLPANEIVIPIMLMGYLSAGSLLELDSLSQLSSLLVANGWTWVTALCVILFSLMHWPCATTLLTIRKETQSLKWTVLAFVIPTLCGFVLCTLVANLARLFGLV
jgi:ferrous iron transport protein B